MVEREDRKVEEKSKLITILGPTACGKTGKAVGLAKSLKGEIISADSRQVYRKMDLGTGKDLEEYGDTPFHLIDICDAGEKFNLHGYIKAFRKALSEIRANENYCIVCGGTGLYLETALEGVQLPDVEANYELREKLESKTLEELTEILKRYKMLHNTTDVDTKKRAIRAIEIADFYRQHPESAMLADRKRSKKLSSLIIGLDIERERRRSRISERLKMRINNGMIEEVEGLLKSGISPEDLIYYGLEYKYLTLYLIGQLRKEEMLRQLEIAIHQFAKRQMTWFRGMEKRGFEINWLPYDMPQDEFNCKVMDLYKK